MANNSPAPTEKIEFITCPYCQGTGQSKFLACKNCQGLGVGAFFQDKFFYFSHKITKTTLALDALQKTVYFILDLAAYILASGGIISLGYWLYATVDKTWPSLPDWEMLAMQSPWLLIFWFSVFVDMFIVYRWSEKRDAQKRIVKNKYQESRQQQDLPRTWQELTKARKKINVVAGCNQQAMAVLASAFNLANQMKHGPIKPLHLFAGLLTSSGEINAFFSRLDIDQQVLASKLSHQLSKLPKTGQETIFSNEAKEVLVAAYLNAYDHNQEELSPLDLILPCYLHDEVIKDILYDMEVDQDKLVNVVAWFAINDQMLHNYRLYRKMARFKPGTNMDRAYTAVATPLLNNFSYDLTLAAKYAQLSLCIGRDKEIEQIFTALKSGKPGALLVGPVGVGKGTMAGGLAQLMVTEKVPPLLSDKRLLELDVARLIGGANPAEAQERLSAIINEIARAKNIVLYIKDIENLLGITSGQEESLDLSEILANALERQAMLIIASVSDINYRQYLEGTPLDRVLEKIEIFEPEINPAIQMIESKMAYLESKYRIYFSYHALLAAVSLTKRYMHEQYLPAKAIELLESVAVRVSQQRGQRALITDQDVALAISDKTRIPLTEVSLEESAKLLNLEEQIHQDMVNQVEAVKMVAASLRRARVQLRSEKRPIASFLFLGPTGVGKTELAKTVAKVYFGQAEYMIRLDMSEYQQADSVKKMIGDPDGTKGYLTEAVRQAPFSLILLDEIEKSHPDILNLFLQVMDDGRLTDGQGKTIDFTNSIIIATSNIGALFIQEQVKKNIDLQSIKQELIDNHLTQKMRPELINRFDGIVVFKPLTLEHVTQIAKLMMRGLQAMLESKGIALQISEAGAATLAKLGYQPEFGARPLRRLIQDKIEDQIANKLLAGEIGRRDVVKINDAGEIEVIKAQRL